MPDYCGHYGKGKGISCEIYCAALHATRAIWSMQSNAVKSHDAFPPALRTLAINPQADEDDKHETHADY